MTDVIPIAVGFVLTTIVGGWWAARLQARSWEEQNESRMREAETARAEQICQDLMSLLDRRLYRMLRLLWATTSNPLDGGELERRRAEYVEVLISWNERLNMNLALVGSYFGDDARAHLDRLYEDYKRVGRNVEAAVRAARAGDDASPIASNVSVEFEGRGIGTLNDRVYQFGLMLMGQLRDGNIGRSAPNQTRPREATD